MVTHSIAIANCGHRAREGSGLRSTVKKHQGTKARKCPAQRGEGHGIDGGHGDARCRQRAAKNDYPDYTQKETKLFAG